MVGKEFTGWRVSSPTGTGERKRGGQQVSPQDADSGDHLQKISFADYFVMTFLVLLVCVSAGMCLFSVRKIASLNGFKCYLFIQYIVFFK